MQIARIRGVAAVLVVAAVVGCGGQTPAGNRPTGTLKGKLSLGGRPFPAKTGIVLQHPETGMLFLALTDETGAFSVSKPTSNMPVGRYDVTVQPASSTDDQTPEQIEAALNGPKGGKSAAPPMEVPKKYRDSHSSGLGFDLQAGANEQNFDLKG